MINLNKLNSGKKLIKEIMDINKSNNAPWSRNKQKEKLNKQHNFKKSK